MTSIDTLFRSPAKAGVQTRREAPIDAQPRASFVSDWAPAFAGEQEDIA